jgi:hypothetical protein
MTHLYGRSRQRRNPSGDQAGAVTTVCTKRIADSTRVLIADNSVTLNRPA